MISGPTHEIVGGKSQFFSFLRCDRHAEMRNDRNAKCVVPARDTYLEIGDPARLPAQLAGRWGQRD